MSSNSRAKNRSMPAKRVSHDDGTSESQLCAFEIIFGREAQTHVGFNFAMCTQNYNCNFYVLFLWSLKRGRERKRGGEGVLIFFK